MAKHTKITIETDTLLVMRGRKPLMAFCPACGVEVEMIPLEETGIVSNLTASEIEAWMQAEDMHRTHALNGALLLCLNSMVRRLHRVSGASHPDTSQP